MPSPAKALENLVREIKDCRVCEKHLPLGPRPVFTHDPRAKVLIISQAPGTKVHEAGIPFHDASGVRLRKWLGVDEKTFYDPAKFAVMPMGFCYPGRGKSGDNPPRKECAPLWHGRLLEFMPRIKLKILVGSYAQKFYLAGRMKENMTETVRNWKEYLPGFFPIVHPSPRNEIWLAKNRWFEKDTVPELKKALARVFFSE